MIDTSSNTVLASYPANAGVLYEAGISPDGSTLYIPAASNGLIVMRTSDGQVLSTVSLPSSTQAAVVTSHGADVFVTGSQSSGSGYAHTVTDVDASTYQVKATYDVKYTPFSFVAAANSSRIFMPFNATLIELATDAPFHTNVSEPQKVRIDVLSVILSAFGFGGLVYGLTLSGESGGAAANRVAAFPVQRPASARTRQARSTSASPMRAHVVPSSRVGCVL